ncbi:MAG: ABC transporter ATP-binding protein/permease [Clostridiales bacterium]|nr:ABC transporter ATP-binding protein/permease [Clostridiales bacterium]
MLELKNITKVYETGSEDVHALNGISLNFRENEFVSILGPSGCGKTTLLNIIGGLDSYTEGDLIINGKTTKKYKNRDWDAYRNHSIGFVFQTYNLIPHQTVLQNVELALALSGVKKSERRKQAKSALEKVGLGDQLKKRPNQLSGGQMQRVAIARAIVNNPDIVLADEPTGALDTETGRQVMETLKEISKDRLVIMVTHNPDLAEEYSTRIVRMLDGVITSDSQPADKNETADSQVAVSDTKKMRRRKKKPSMSFGTSFGLSLKNLFTKKGRTALTSFAGSIGIIGIALIYAVSQGTTNYIEYVQEETLTSYPISIRQKNVDMSSLIETFMGRGKSTGEHKNDSVYQKAMLYELMNTVNTLDERENDLKAFKKYIEKQRKDSDSALSKALSGVQYGYNLDLLVYTQNVDSDIIRCDAETLFTQAMKDYADMDMSSMLALRQQTTFGSMDNMLTSSSKVWQELIPGDNGDVMNDVVESKYKLLYGKWPSKYNEVVLFVDKNNELNDLTLYTLGLKSADEIDKLFKASLNHEEVDYEIQKWSYKEICGMDFRVILNSDCFSYDDEKEIYVDLRDTSAGLKYLYDNAINLRVTGIAKVDEDSVSSDENGHIGYTYKLTEYVIDKALKSSAIKAQQKDSDIDIFTGLKFKDADTELDNKAKAQKFKDYVSRLNTEEKSDLYVKISGIPKDEDVQAFVDQTLGDASREELENSVYQSISSQMNMNDEDIRSYIYNMTDEELYQMLSQYISQQYTEQYSAQVTVQLSALSGEQLAAAFEAAMKEYTVEDSAYYYDNVIEFSDSSYKDNLIKLGCIDLNTPSTVNLYASSFADKEVIEDVIAEYNESADELQKIEYTDYVGIIMSSVTTIIDAITYVLIAFVAVSLIVSSIMIGVITLISVQERTKEIGILRAIGASKRNVSGMFNAETVIIGFTSGTFGVLITYLLCIPINAILHSLTGINNLSAVLPAPVAAGLVVISMLLTLAAGIIPSRSAAKKDPVVALRTE